MTVDTYLNGSGNAAHTTAKPTKTTAQHIQTSERSFALTSPGLHYRFHASEDGELVNDHFGAPAPNLATNEATGLESGWGPGLLDEAREFPDSGRGDYRLPAVHIKHAAGHSVSYFQYASHEVVAGKPALDGLPATFGTANEVSTLLVHMKDEESSLEATLRYSIFPAHNAIARSWSITNSGTGEVEIQRAASFPLNLDAGDWEFLQLSGDWSRECHQSRRVVQTGMQGFQQATGYSSHYFNPFVGLVRPDTTESSGEGYALSLIWSGSFSCDIERFAAGTVRAQLGMNPLHLAYPLAPGQTFTSPECVAVYTASGGIGALSRQLHRLYRNNLSRSPWTHKARPALLNSWEGMYFDFDAASLYEKAKNAAEVGVKLYVMDDGWFGNKHPRLSDNAGLGDWFVNPERFPDGLGPFVNKINDLQVKGTGKPLQFGLWVEPEMVNPSSELYEAHPEWVLHAGRRPRTERRSQLVLNLALPEVQDYIISHISDILSSANIAYVKWDNNRAMHELPSAHTAYTYMLGLYRVLDELTTRHPDVLWEGCASGGARFDPGILHYWPQSWTSDDTDAVERLHIQFGTSLAYPPSSMGAHISACPNHQVFRTTPLEFRAHVALMGGSFGFELDLDVMSKEEKAELPAVIALSDKVSPYVIHGDQYRLALPDTNWPAVQYMSEDAAEGVLLAYQIEAKLRITPPPLRLQGLDAEAEYEVDGVRWSGGALANSGLKMKWEVKDHQSKVIFIRRV